MGRKHCGERRNCSLRAISPFPTVFQKACFPERQKVSLCGNELNSVFIRVHANVAAGARRISLGILFFINSIYSVSVPKSRSEAIAYSYSEHGYYKCIDPCQTINFRLFQAERVCRRQFQI